MVARRVWDVEVPGSSPGTPTHSNIYVLSVNCYMPYFVYIVRCVDGYLYTGITWNLKKRLKEHNTGIRTVLKQSQLPAKLVYWERFLTRIEAAKKEKVIKGWRRLKKEKLIDSLR